METGSSPTETGTKWRVSDCNEWKVPFRSNQDFQRWLIWGLYDEIHDKIIEKNIFNYNAMTLKKIHESVDRVRISSES
jgi:hypothetical protein